jgi:hypothetical protein
MAFKLDAESLDSSTVDILEEKLKEIGKEKKNCIIA